MSVVLKFFFWRCYTVGPIRSAQPLHTRLCHVMFKKRFQSLLEMAALILTRECTLGQSNDKKCFRLLALNFGLTSLTTNALLLHTWNNENYAIVLEFDHFVLKFIRFWSTSKIYIRNSKYFPKSEVLFVISLDHCVALCLIIFFVRQGQVHDQVQPYLHNVTKKKHYSN